MMAARVFSSRMAIGSATCILVVEDVEALRKIIRQLLEREDCIVIEASGRESALLALREHREIDAALIDVSLPSIHGPDLLHLLRELTPALPAVFMSGHPVEAVRGIGSEGFIRKPFSREELLAALESATG